MPSCCDRGIGNFLDASIVERSLPTTSSHARMASSLSLDPLKCSRSMAIASCQYLDLRLFGERGELFAAGNQGPKDD